MIKADFLLSNYEYDLPLEKIAQYPSNPRESAKLLVYERSSGRITHSDFFHFCDFVPDSSLIVFNDTRVIKARMYGYKIREAFSKHIISPKIYEVFYHKKFEEGFLVQIKGSVKAGSWLLLGDIKSPFGFMEVLKCYEDGLRKVRFYDEKNRIIKISRVLRMLEAHGEMPLPPYIKRKGNLNDINAYQTVFATNIGAVAAPTASLHFSLNSMREIMSRFETCFITLHIGAGTFRGVESEDIRAHKIHNESYAISLESARAIDSAKRVLCIGTTAARLVEYHARHKPLRGECDMFLHPGVKFKRVDSLLTNFHLPKSTLLMLVSAMIGREKCLEIYEIAKDSGYKFYSYGDGMLII